jgi:hypothetical protein
VSAEPTSALFVEAAERIYGVSLVLKDRLGFRLPEGWAGPA